MPSFSFIIVISVVVGKYIVGCGAQNIIFIDEDENVEEDVVQPITIPETLLMRLRNVSSISDFRNLFLPRNITMTPIATGSSSTIGGKNALSSAPQRTPVFYKPAVCQPEEHVVELEKPESTDIMYWPSCIRVRRCGGCCTSKMLSCNPVATSNISIQVLRVRYNPQSPMFEDEGSRTFTVEQHDRCVCSCKEQPDDCDPDVHDYRESECKCVCRNQEESSSCTGRRKFWDPKDCRCKCRVIRLCSTGWFFNTRKCRCEVLKETLSVYVSNTSEN